MYFISFNYLQQALSKSPFNSQLIRAFRYCNEPEETRFPALVRGDLADILAILPPEETTGAVVVSKLQAIVKGAIERTGLRLGIGAKKAITRPMMAKLGVLLRGMPLLLRVQANWMGKVACIIVYDVRKDNAYKVKLRTPFTPTRETGAPRKLELTLHVLKKPMSNLTTHQRSSGDEGGDGGRGDEGGDDADQCSTELIMKFTDHETGYYSYRRMRLDLLSFHAQEESSSGDGDDDGRKIDDNDRGVSELAVALEDLSIAEHRSTLALPSDQPSLLNALLQDSMMAMHGSVALTASDNPSSPSYSASLLDSESRRLGATHAGLYTSVEEEVFSVVSVTNAVTVEVAKEGFEYGGRHYLVRVVNEHDVTQVTLMQLHSDKVFVFLMAREHIDRAHSLKKRWTLLLSILERNPVTAPMVRSATIGSSAALLSENFSQVTGPSELFSSQEADYQQDHDDPTDSTGRGLGRVRNPNPLQLSPTERQQAIAALQTPLTILGINVFTSMLPRGNGASLILVSPQNHPIIGTGREVVDTADTTLTPTSISLLRDSTSHRFRSQEFAASFEAEEEEEDEKEEGERGDYSQVQKFGEHMGFDSEDGYLISNTSQVDAEGEEERDVEDGSAYELVGGAAAVRLNSGKGDPLFALSPEEYALLMQQEQEQEQQLRDGLYGRADGDMIGLRFGGALDDDSVSQIMWGNSVSVENHIISGKASPMPVSMPVSPHRAEHHLPGANLSETEETSAQAQSPLPSGAAASNNAFQTEALKDLAETMDFIANVTEKGEQIPAFPLQPAPAVPATAFALENRLTAARQSISLGMNLGAALAAALTSEGKRAGASSGAVGVEAPHPSDAAGRKRSKASVAHPSKEPAAVPSGRRRSSVSKHKDAVLALVKVKAAALAVTSLVVGSALNAATATITAGGRNAIPGALIPTLSCSLDVITEEEDDEGESRSSTTAKGSSARSAVEATVEAAVEMEAAAAVAASSVSVPGSGGSETADEDDWIARLFKEADFPDSTDDASVQDDDGGAVGIAELRAGSPDSNVSEGTETEADADEAGESAAQLLAMAEQVDIEWIVELGSSGAVETFEDTVLEELLQEGVKFLSEVYSDQIAPLRAPVVDAAVGVAVQSVVEFTVHSDRMANELMEREIGFQSACVTLVNLLEEVAVQGACRKILAAEKQKALALKRKANEELARALSAAAAAAAAETAAAAAATEVMITPRKSTGRSNAGSPSTVPSPGSTERTPYRALIISPSEKQAALDVEKSGYFVKKIRSHISAVGSGSGEMAAVTSAGLRSQSASQISIAGSHRLISTRDIFTPELPPSLQDPHLHPRPHTHHVQLTSQRGGVSLTSTQEPMQLTHSALLSGGIDEAGDMILAQSGVPLHITDHSEDRFWEGAEPSLDNYFRLQDSQQVPPPSSSDSLMVTRTIPGRSVAQVSKHNRQVHHSRKAQNRNKPTEESPPLWLQLGGAGSASFLLPEGSTLLDSSDPQALYNAPASFDAHSSLAHFPGATAPLPLPLPTPNREMPSGDVPIVSMLYARAQSPAMPAAGLPSFAYDSAEGLKAALQSNWDGRTIPQYWSSALKQRADERINEPFAVKSAIARKQRKAIKAKAAFAATAAASAVNSTAHTREEMDRQFTKLLDENEQLHESFFESRLDPFGATDTPFPNRILRSQSQAQDLTAAATSHVNFTDAGVGGGGAGGVLNRVSTAPAGAVRKSSAHPDTFGSVSAQIKSHQPSMHRPASSGSRLTGPELHRTSKGLAHSHDYDDSNLLSNQVEPPFHHINTRIAIRSPPDMAVHFRRSTAAIGEQIDAAVEREQVDDMFRHSLEIFHKIGYVQKRPLPHATHWVRVVSEYLASLRSIDELRKRLATLTRASPREMTTEESVCVLADTKGVVGQAIEKLKHLEYFSEIKLACRSVNIRGMVQLLEGGEEVYKFKVGEGRSRTTSVEQFPFFDGSQTSRSPFDTLPGSSLFRGVDDETVKAASIVTDPYAPQMVEQHREVVAHRKIREHYDELELGKSQKLRGNSAKLSAAAVGNRSSSLSASFGVGLEEDGAVAGASCKAATADATSAEGAFAAQVTRSLTVDSTATTTATAPKNMESASLFLPGVQPLLRQDSKFVRARANMVTLSGPVSASPSSGVEGGESISVAEGSGAVPMASKNHIRSSLRMSVTSPKRASALVTNTRSSVAGSFSSNYLNNRLMGAIAAAVAAADSAEEREDRDEGGEGEGAGFDGPTGAAGRKSRMGSMTINTGFGANSSSGTRSSFKLTPSHAAAQKAWRRNSGIFEHSTPRTSSAADGSQQSSRENTPKHATTRSSSRKSRGSDVSYGSRGRSSSPGSPSWRDHQQQQDQWGEGGEGADEVVKGLASVAGVGGVVGGVGFLATADENEEEEEGEEEGEEDAQQNVPFDSSHPWGSKISINPWYLSHQQATSPKSQSKVVKLAQTKQHLQRQQQQPVLVKQKSYRTANIVHEIFEQEAVGVPFAVMSRRDAERAAKEETLTRSDKLYIRRSVEMRAEKVQHS